MMTRLELSTRIAELTDEAVVNTAKAVREERNMRVFLLRKRGLSCRNWGRATSGIGHTDFWPPGSERRERNIKESALKHEQKGYREELLMSNGEPDKVTKVYRKAHFGDRQK